jgi:1-aminocyclopropane-1-carboxylate deaminase
MFPAAEKIVYPERVCVEPLVWPELMKKAIHADVLRLDKIHPVISGNKWFKLNPYIQDATEKKYHAILTFGGAFSNHIIATAYLSQKIGFAAKGVIRGERSEKISQTLLEAEAYGMQLKFESRQAYAQKNEAQYLIALKKNHPEYYLIPEGGAGDLGIKGSQHILDLVEISKYSHILCAVGTGTMLMGIVNASKRGQKVLGISVLKAMSDPLEGEMGRLIDPKKRKDCQFHNAYHFGGYAKSPPELIDFMNRLYQISRLPTDFVYTAKLIYAALDLAQKDFFPKASNLLLIHSGGLQGNRSLPNGALIF